MVRADESTGAVAVLGAGQMGSGIAQVCAAAGFRVLLHDSDKNQLSAARAAMQKSAARLCEKGAISEKQEAAVREIELHEEITGEFRRAGTVIEAIVEDAEAKKRLYEKLADNLWETSVLASNTSSCSITELAAASPAPERFAGMHFMNPAPLMKLVEVIPGLQTAEETSAKIESLARALGKETVRAADSPGFVTNRILMPLLNEAFFALQENLASAEGIDRAMKLGMNHPMGPLALADFIGLDTVLAVLKVLHEGLGDPKFRPCPLLKTMVAAGFLGKKSGRGFYEY